MLRSAVNGIHQTACKALYILHNHCKRQFGLKNIGLLMATLRNAMSPPMFAEIRNKSASEKQIHDHMLKQ